MNVLAFIVHVQHCKYMYVLVMYVCVYMYSKPNTYQNSKIVKQIIILNTCKDIYIYQFLGALVILCSMFVTEESDTCDFKPFEECVT